MNVIVAHDCRNCPFVQYPPMEVGFAFTTCGHPKGGFVLHHEERAMRPVPIRPQGTDTCPLFKYPVTYSGGVTTIAENELVCNTCGQFFTIPPAAAKKYPLWRPKQCLACKARRQAADEAWQKAADEAGDYDYEDLDDHPGHPRSFG